MIYSVGKRERILKIVREGRKISQIAKKYMLSRNTIYRWQRKKEIKGSLGDEGPKRRHKKLDPVELEKYVRLNNQLMRKDYAKHFSVDPKSISNAFAKLKITRKKRLIYIEKEMKKKESYIWSI